VTALVVVGAGGHAKVVADVAALAGHEVLAFVDESGRTSGTRLHDIPVLASVDERPEAGVALGIGDNRARWDRYTDLRSRGRDAPTLVHPSAVVDRTVQLGQGTVVMAGVCINADAVVGDAAVLNTGCSVDHDCRLGDAVHLAPGVRLAGAVDVGDGALLGVASAVVPGRSVGEWSVCGAGSVLVQDVPAGRTVKGVPAR
jgi:sugar O-acyltransferase (sialic acid O-acetyltransferase NeuD family)